MAKPTLFKFVCKRTSEGGANAGACGCEEPGECYLTDHEDFEFYLMAGKLIFNREVDRLTKILMKCSEAEAQARADAFARNFHA